MLSFGFVEGFKTNSCSPKVSWCIHLNHVSVSLITFKNQAYISVKTLFRNATPSRHSWAQLIIHAWNSTVYVVHVYNKWDEGCRRCESQHTTVRAWAGTTMRDKQQDHPHPLVMGGVQGWRGCTWNREAGGAFRVRRSICKKNVLFLLNGIQSCCCSFSFKRWRRVTTKNSQ